MVWRLNDTVTFSWKWCPLVAIDEIGYIFDKSLWIEDGRVRRNTGKKERLRVQKMRHLLGLGVWGIKCSGIGWELMGIPKEIILLACLYILRLEAPALQIFITRMSKRNKQTWQVQRDFNLIVHFERKIFYNKKNQGCYLCVFLSN